MKVFWFDIETSGLDPARHGIISLAYAVEILGEIVAEGELNSNCQGKEIEDSALDINGFLRDQIALFGSPRMLYEDLEYLFGQYVSKYDPADKFYAGGMNVQSFDLAFLRQLWKDEGDQYFGSWFQYGAIDPGALVPVMRYAGLLPGWPAKSKLKDMAEYLGIQPDGELHTAAADIRLTRQVFLALLYRILPPVERTPE
jgi:DNA polymerase-3 subunit epsilon